MQDKQTIFRITNTAGTHNPTSASVLKFDNESAYQQGIVGLEAPALECFSSPQSEFSRCERACGGGVCVRCWCCYSGNIINERRSSLKMNWQCASPLKMFRLYWARPEHEHTWAGIQNCVHLHAKPIQTYRSWIPCWPWEFLRLGWWEVASKTEVYRL